MNFPYTCNKTVHYHNYTAPIRICFNNETHWSGKPVGGGGWWVGVIGGGGGGGSQDLAGVVRIFQILLQDTT